MPVDLEQRARELKAQRDSLASDFSSGEYRRAGALEYGSAESYSQSLRGSEGSEPLVKSNEEILAEAKKENRLLSDNLRALKDIGNNLKTVEIA